MIIGTCAVSRTPLRSVAVRGKVADLGIEGGERRHRGSQHVHRMRRAHQADDVENSRRKRACRLELGVEALELGARRQFAVQQKAAGLLERRARGEVVDRIAAIEELACAAIDEADARAIEVNALQPAMDLDLVGVLGHRAS
jgi:hypothetical protein